MKTRPSAKTLESEIAPDEMATLQEVLRSSSLQGAHLEIGTAAGGTLCAMMKCYEDANRPQFVVVDPMDYFDRQLEIVKQNLGNHGLPEAGVSFRVDYSNIALEKSLQAGEKFDFMFIDGNHKIRFVTQDLAWTRMLQPGGLVCFHDYGPGSPGVVLPVKRFLRKHPNYKVFRHTRNLLILQKVSASRKPEVGPVDHLWAALLSPCLQLSYSINKRRRRRQAKAAASGSN